MKNSEMFSEAFVFHSQIDLNFWYWGKFLTDLLFLEIHLWYSIIFDKGRIKLVKREPCCQVEKIFSSWIRHIFCILSESRNKMVKSISKIKWLCLSSQICCWIGYIYNSCDIIAIWGKRVSKTEKNVRIEFNSIALNI